LLRTSAILALLAAASFGSLTPSLVMGFRHELGVETKMLGGCGARWQIHPRFGVTGGVAFSLIQHNGLSALALGADALLFDFGNIGLAAGVQHEQWNDWQAGENRAFGIVTAEPVRGLELAAGAAWRVPLLDAERYMSPFNWQSAVPEWNLLYRVEWTFLKRRQAEASAWMANIDRLTVHNPQQFPFGLRGAHGLGRGWSLLGNCGTAINGLSGVLLSLSEVTLEFGVARAF